MGDTTKDGTETRERDGTDCIIISPNISDIPPPNTTVPANGMADDSGDVMHRERKSTTPPSPFTSTAKMIGLEDPEDVEPFKDTITHLHIVISNLECFEFTEQRRTAIRRMTELIVKYLEE